MTTTARMTSTKDKEFTSQRPLMPPGECCTFGTSDFGGGSGLRFCLRFVIENDLSDAAYQAAECALTPRGRIRG